MAGVVKYLWQEKSAAEAQSILKEGLGADGELRKQLLDSGIQIEHTQVKLVTHERNDGWSLTCIFTRQFRLDGKSFAESFDASHTPCL